MRTRPQNPAEVSVPRQFLPIWHWSTAQISFPPLMRRLPRLRSRLCAGNSRDRAMFILKNQDELQPELQHCSPSVPLRPPQGPGAPSRRPACPPHLPGPPASRVRLPFAPALCFVRVTDSNGNDISLPGFVNPESRCRRSRSAQVFPDGPAP